MVCVVRQALKSPRTPQLSASHAKKSVVLMPGSSSDDVTLPSSASGTFMHLLSQFIRFLK